LKIAGAYHLMPTDPATEYKCCEAPTEEPNLVAFFCETVACHYPHVPTFYDKGLATMYSWEKFPLKIPKLGFVRRQIVHTPTVRFAESFETVDKFSFFMICSYVAPQNGFLEAC